MERIGRTPNRRVDVMVGRCGRLARRTQLSRVERSTVVMLGVLAAGVFASKKQGRTLTWLKLERVCSRMV